MSEHLTTPIEDCNPRLEPSAVHGTIEQHRIWPLVFAVTIPVWSYLAGTRVLSFAIVEAGYPGVIIAPPYVRLLQHLLLLPLLLFSYRWALAVGWPREHRLRALLFHSVMALFFALVARPVLVALVAADERDWGILNELFASIFGKQLSWALWVSSGLDFLLSYVLGLAVLLGVKHHRELKDHKLRVATLEAGWTRARLQALRMQLNPHFLFNTLNAAVALVAHRPAATEEMLVRLSDLLRRTLRDGDVEFITLQSELDFIRNYLEIQRLRFPDRLSFDITADAEALQALVPSLILQPLAENAVIHGVATDSDHVEVTISARQTGPMLELIVRNSASVSPASKQRGGIGLTNTRERLEALFGARHSLTLVREDSGVVTARLRVPMIENTGGAT